MAFTGKLALGVKRGALLSSSMGLRRSNARPFSSLLQNSSSRAPRTLFVPRYLSTTPSTPVNPADIAQEPVTAATAAIPDASSGFADGLEAVSTLAGQLQPLQYGDLSALGLTGWNPAGLVRWSLEVINVTTDMPWFWTIVAGTVFWRVVCLPFTIESLRATALMQPHGKQMTRLREGILASSKTGSTLDLLRAQGAMKAYQKEHNLSPLKSAYGLIQLPVTLGLFFGIQKMASLPVEQLKQSGLAAIPDLTVPDPTWIMPAVMMVVVNTQISAGVKDMDMAERPAMGHLMNGLRVLSFAGFFMMIDFTSGLMISLLTTSTFTLVQTIVLQHPIVRALLDIPIIPREKQGKLPPFMDTVRAAVAYIKGSRDAFNVQPNVNPFRQHTRRS